MITRKKIQGLQEIKEEVKKGLQIKKPFWKIPFNWEDYLIIGIVGASILLFLMTFREGYPIMIFVLAIIFVMRRLKKQ